MTTRSELSRMIAKAIVQNGGKLISPTGSTAWGSQAGEMYVQGVVDHAALAAARQAQGAWGNQDTIGSYATHDYTPEQVASILDEISEMTKGQKSGPNFLKIGLTTQVLENVEATVRSS